LSVGEEWDRRNLEELISSQSFKDERNTKKHRSKEEEGKGRQLPKN
jgi:hypothetical protein